MEKSTNSYQGKRIEYHILQSFPVTCLNRDDVGAPKTAIVGGTTRARVSSQCWKRQIRLALRELGVSLGTRTKLIGDFIKDACVQAGAKPDAAADCGRIIEHVFIKSAEGNDENEGNGDGDGKDEKTDTLLFLSNREVQLIANKFKELQFKSDKFFTQKDTKKQAKELAKLIGKPNFALDGLDIALFGRMVAQAAQLNVEAATSFSHAISTHKVANEVEFFTALDDRSEEPGSAHMGSLEFNSATYYRYICLDLGQLYQNLGGGDLISKAVEAFTKALYIAVPSARQSTQSGASYWEYAKILFRKGQRLQVPFETPVKRDKEGGFLKNSILELNNYLLKKEKQAGSLFGKITEYTFGEEDVFSIDKLANQLEKDIKA
jgi:CRISPR system Cascade subunit CasC